MNFDFDSIKAELESRLSLLSNWSTTLYYGVYNRINDVIAYITDKLAYQSEWLYNEANWELMTQFESALQKVKMLQYTPYRKTGAIGNLTVSGSSTFSDIYIYTGEDVTIPRWTQFSNSDGDVFVYCTDETIYYKGTVGDLSVPVAEGTYTEYLYIAEGIADEELSIAIPNIDNDEIEVLIVNSDNETLYTVRICGTGNYSNDIYLIEDLDNYYCQIRNFYDFEGIYITFGDGIRNKKLEANDRVLVKYGATNGDDGDITSSGIIDTIVDTLYDANGSEATLYVTNEDEISDGSDVESLTSIKANASNLFATGYRAGSSYDWDSIIESFSYVDKAVVWSSEDIDDDTAENQSKVYVCVLSSDGSDLTDAQETALTNTLKEYKSPTEILTFQSLQKIYLLFNIDAVITNQTSDVMDEIIYSALDDEYGATNVAFQTNIYQSNYIALIDDLDEIVHHTTTCEYVEKNLDPTETEYALTACLTTGDNEDQIWLTSGSVGLWLERKVGGTWISGAIQIGDEISGSLLGQNGFTIDSSTINRAENLVSFSISEITSGSYGTQNPGSSTDDGYILSISYTTEDANGEQTNDIRLGSRRNITDIDQDFIFTTYEYE